MDTERGRIVVVRHGQTEWSSSGRHTGRTDVPLTAYGEQQAVGLGPVLAEYDPRLVLSSPMVRARHTAQLAGFEPIVDSDLMERAYGGVEGLTTVAIRRVLRDDRWDVWASDLAPIPGLPVPADAAHSMGESLQEVAIRTQRVFDRCQPVLDSGHNVMLFSHGHTLRILAATWMLLAPGAGEHLLLDAAHLGVLGHERSTQVLERWNVPPPG